MIVVSDEDTIVKKGDERNNFIREVKRWKQQTK